MSDSLYREHTATRDYLCGRECGTPIVAGSRYVGDGVTHGAFSESDGDYTYLPRRES